MKSLFGRMFKRRKFITEGTKKKIMKHIFLFSFLTAVLCGIIFAGIFLFFTYDLPSPQELGEQQVIESTKIYDRTEETLLYELFEEERRTVISKDEVPDYVRNATIAIEDESFYEHGAIDLPAIARAVVANIMAGSKQQGGSTITQQLAKNAFLTPEKSYIRKIKELILAMRLEKQFTKDEILHLYLNQIPYGGNAYGIESASQTYFNMSASELNLPQAALLASLPQAPTYYSPWGSHVEDLLNRKNYVLERMYDLGYITLEEKVDAQEYEFEFEKSKGALKAPHFSIEVQEYLIDKYGEDFVRRSGLKVITTLDWDIQQIAEKVIAEGVERNTELYGGTNAALVAQDTNTGQILAMVGSKDYFSEDIDGNFNVATQGLRQPGSATKPFTYMTAFKKGLTPKTVVFDVLTEFAAAGAKSYQPKNFDFAFRGPVQLEVALAQSMNIPAVKTLYIAGIDNVIQTLRDFGVTTLEDKDRIGLSLVLGGGEVTLKQLVGAYATLAEEGVYHPQSYILRIEDRDGNILEEFEPEEKRVVAKEYPRLINNILSSAELRSGLFRNSLGLTVFPGYDVALKTGTSNDYRDVWAFGYTPNFAVGIWTGNNDNKPMSPNGGYVFSAIPMWSAFLREALPETESENFAIVEAPQTDKPILNGSPIVNYKDGGDDYPQVHNILFYIDKNNPLGLEPQRAADPQYANWESSVNQWAKENVPGFDSGQYNQTIPPGSIPEPYDPSKISQISEDQSVVIISPENNGTISGDSINLQMSIVLEKKIKEIKVYLNNNLIDEQQGFFEESYTYNQTVQFDEDILKTKNTLRVRVRDEDRDTYEAELTLRKEN
ncbi:MAG: PBP1A family penicillin-binding protein [Candidatus Paceibacterota bacterium]